MKTKSKSRAEIDSKLSINGEVLPPTKSTLVLTTTQKSRPKVVTKFNSDLLQLKANSSAIYRISQFKRSMKPTFAFQWLTSKIQISSWEEGCPALPKHKVNFDMVHFLPSPQEQSNTWQGRHASWKRGWGEGSFVRLKKSSALVWSVGISKTFLLQHYHRGSFSLNGKAAVCWELIPT